MCMISSVLCSQINSLWLTVQYVGEASPVTVLLNEHLCSRHDMMSWEVSCLVRRCFLAVFAGMGHLKNKLFKLYVSMCVGFSFLHQKGGHNVSREKKGTSKQINAMFGVS